MYDLDLDIDLYEEIVEIARKQRHAKKRIYNVIPRQKRTQPVLKYTRQLHETSTVPRSYKSVEKSPTKKCKTRYIDLNTSNRHST